MHRWLAPQNNIEYMGLVPLYRPINPIHMNPPIHQSNAWEGCSPLLEGEPDSPEGEPEGAAEFLLYTLREELPVLSFSPLIPYS